MFNRLAGFIVIFSILSLALLFSGFSPTLNLNRYSTELPKPKVYTVSEYGEILSKNTPRTKLIASGSLNTSIVLNKDSYRCLRKNIYFEARDQNVFGQLLVGMVTLSRVNWAKSKRYPDDICAVVFQRKQFSWANNGVRKPVLNNKDEVIAWMIAGLIAEASNMGFIMGLDKLFSHMTHYHADYVNPSWSKSNKFVEIGKIGNHIFYSEST